MDNHVILLDVESATAQEPASDSRPKALATTGMKTFFAWLRTHVSSPRADGGWRQYISFIEGNIFEKWWKPLQELPSLEDISHTMMSCLSVMLEMSLGQPSGTHQGRPAKRAVPPSDPPAPAHPPLQPGQRTSWMSTPPATVALSATRQAALQQPPLPSAPPPPSTPLGPRPHLIDAPATPSEGAPSHSWPPTPRWPQTPTPSEMSCDEQLHARGCGDQMRQHGIGVCWAVLPSVSRPHDDSDLRDTCNTLGIQVPHVRKMDPWCRHRAPLDAAHDTYKPLAARIHDSDWHHSGGPPRECPELSEDAHFMMRCLHRHLPRHIIKRPTRSSTNEDRFARNYGRKFATFARERGAVERVDAAPRMRVDAALPVLRSWLETKVDGSSNTFDWAGFTMSPGDITRTTEKAYADWLSGYM